MALIVETDQLKIPKLVTELRCSPQNEPPYNPISLIDKGMNSILNGSQVNPIMSDFLAPSEALLLYLCYRKILSPVEGIGVPVKDGKVIVPMADFELRPYQYQIFPVEGPIEDQDYSVKITLGTGRFYNPLFRIENGNSLGDNEGHDLIKLTLKWIDGDVSSTVFRFSPTRISRQDIGGEPVFSSLGMKDPERLSYLGKWLMERPRDRRLEEYRAALQEFKRTVAHIPPVGSSS